MASCSRRRTPASGGLRLTAGAKTPTGIRDLTPLIAALNRRFAVKIAPSTTRRRRCFARTGRAAALVS
jgi:hypothetical protein